MDDDYRGLRVVGQGEFPDTRLPRVRRAELKSLAFDLCVYHCNSSADETRYLASALEEAAQTKEHVDLAAALGESAQKKQSSRGNDRGSDPA